jgi:hypothetical protein
MEVVKKVCTECGEPKPLDEYWNHPTGKYGKRPRCKECLRKENAEFEKTYRPSRQEKSHEWYERNKEAVKEKALAGGRRWVYKPDNKRNHNLKTRYGITAKEYDALLEAQDGKCAICSRKMDEGRRLAVDHDHDTGEVRGILHVRCNTAIALFKDSPETCRKAADYLEKHRVLAVLIGLHVHA